MTTSGILLTEMCASSRILCACTHTNTNWRLGLLEYLCTSIKWPMTWSGRVARKHDRLSITFLKGKNNIYAAFIITNNMVDTHKGGEFILNNLYTAFIVTNNSVLEILHSGMLHPTRTRKKTSNEHKSNNL